MVVDICPTYPICSQSDPPVVNNRASLKQNEKPLFTIFIALLLKTVLSASRIVISYWI